MPSCILRSFENSRKSTIMYSTELRLVVCPSRLCAIFSGRIAFHRDVFCSGLTSEWITSNSRWTSSSSRPPPLHSYPPFETVRNVECHPIRMFEGFVNRTPFPRSATLADSLRRPVSNFSHSYALIWWEKFARGHLGQNHPHRRTWFIGRNNEHTHKRIGNSFPDFLVISVKSKRVESGRKQQQIRYVRSSGIIYWPRLKLNVWYKFWGQFIRSIRNVLFWSAEKKTPPNANIRTSFRHPTLLPNPGREDSLTTYKPQNPPHPLRVEFHRLREKRRHPSGGSERNTHNLISRKRWE